MPPTRAPVAGAEDHRTPLAWFFQEVDRLGLTPDECRMYMHIACQGDQPPDPECCFRSSQMTASPNALRKRASAALKGLTEKRLIASQRTRTTDGENHNTYYLLPPSQWTACAIHYNIQPAAPAWLGNQTQTTPENEPQAESTHTIAPHAGARVPAHAPAPVGIIINNTKRSDLRSTDQVEIDPDQIYDRDDLQKSSKSVTETVRLTAHGESGVRRTPTQHTDRQRRPQLATKTVTVRLPDRPQPKLTQPHTNRSHYDPAKFTQNGNCPRGLGSTPYEVYREAFAEQLTHATITMLSETITDLGKWRTVTTEWLLRGYRPNNIQGMLNVYANGWREEQALQANQNATPSLGTAGNVVNTYDYALPAQDAEAINAQRRAALAARQAKRE